MGTLAHVSVLLSRSVELLQPAPGRTLLDGTAGAGGHAEAFAERGARVIALDRDPWAARATSERLRRFGSGCTVIQENFARAAEAVNSLGLSGVDGALLDLGMSSPQIDEAERGFSFQAAGPLDMRMESKGETAAELLRRLDEAEIAELLRELGEEPFARRIARSIKQAPRMETTEDLTEAVKRAVPRASWPRRIHVATRTFQALRMAVNQELEALAAFLQSLPTLLLPLGRAAIISFHSLEDRQVKRHFADLAGACRCPPGLPVCACGAAATFRLLTRKAIQADEAEVAQNPRARSARLRAVEKLKVAA